MQRRTTILAVSIVAAILVVSVYALTASTAIAHHGKIKTINVNAYQDVACTILLTNIDWGILDPNSVTVKTFYIKNIGNSPMKLNMTVSSWVPSNATTYITVTWNQEGTTVPAGASVQTNATLTVASTITGITDFSFTMTITGSG